MNVKKTRASETRAANRRPEGWLPPNAMPTDINLGPGIKLRWIRKFFNGAEEDKTNFFKRARRGWTPVKVEELPDLEYLRDGDGFIAMSGCILCKIDASIVAHDVEYYEDLALGAARHAQDEYTSDSDERMAKFAEGGKARVIKGRVPVGA